MLRHSPNQIRRRSDHLQVPGGEAVCAIDVVEFVELIHIQDEEMDWKILLCVEVNFELIRGGGVKEEIIVHEAKGIRRIVRGRFRVT